MSSKNVPKGNGSRKPYSKPTLTVHGDLRTVTATKGSSRREPGRPRTFNSGRW